MTSVVIPAHDEERQIAACLGSLLEDARPGELEVVVVCNGCRDRTADIARGFGPDVRVLELAEAFKSAALNAGDACATRFPRIYLDADTQLSTSGARALRRVLAEGAPVAYPRVSADLVAAPLGIRLYYRMWRELCYARRDLIGTGVYSLSKEGRQRFGAFPLTVGDDYFVRRLFRRDETAIADGAESRIRLPGSLRQLVRVNTRVFCGNARCEVHYGHQLQSEEGRLSFLRVVRRRATLWPAAAVYAFVIGVSKLRAAWRLRFGDPENWSRDETERGSSQAPRHPGRAA